LKTASFSAADQGVRPEAKSKHNHGQKAENTTEYISPGISPGAAAPLELLPDFSTLSNVPAPAASGFSGLVVHEKIYLCMTNLLQMAFERVVCQANLTSQRDVEQFSV